MYKTDVHFYSGNFENVISWMWILHAKWTCEYLPKASHVVTVKICTFRKHASRVAGQPSGEQANVVKWANQVLCQNYTFMCIALNKKCNLLHFKQTTFQVLGNLTIVIKLLTWFEHTKNILAWL